MGTSRDTLTFRRQHAGYSAVGTLSGWLERHTGFVFITLGGTDMRGIFLDNDHAALTYETTKTGCSGRVSGLRIR